MTEANLLESLETERSPLELKIEPMKLDIKVLAADKHGPDRLPTEENTSEDARLEMLKRQVETKAKTHG